MVLKGALFALAFAALVPVLYDWARLLVLFYKNAPGRMAPVNNLGEYEVKFTEIIRSCEDALLVESAGLAILACDPGREKWNTVMGIFLPGPVADAGLYAYDYANASAVDADALRQIEIRGFERGADFHTLGIAYDEATGTLFAANHRRGGGGGAAVEAFALDLGALTATHARTIRHPLLHAPNAIAVAGGGELLVTNDHGFAARRWPRLAALETYLGLPLGTVVHVDLGAPGGGVRARVLARLAFANGVALLDARTVAVASTSAAAVQLYDFAPRPPALAPRARLRLPFLPDNLHVARDGALLVAGHPHPPALSRFARSRDACNGGGDGGRCDADAAPAPSWVSRWTEARGLEHVYAGSEYPTSSTALFDAERRVGIVTGLRAATIAGGDFASKDGYRRRWDSSNNE
ncbi:putative paraoxonase [Durotheca rogersii]|uniref:putative paraoxonase n=1 Tax=Durotheca rogersii TaxID=419775 RepID=UPI00221F5ECF|nr:putative paraoxonase [Durotheca rogersii]KAI5859564.1 putative paraoxonase [Durotheca rogersii]